MMASALQRVRLTVLLLLAGAFAGRPALAQPPPVRVTVQGRVLDAKTRRPVPGATVRLRIRNTDRILPIPGMNATLTDAAGAFTFKGIPEGDYTISAFPGSNPGRQAANSSQQVTARARMAPVEVLLRPPPSLHGTLTRPDRKPAANQRLTFLISGQSLALFLSAATDRQGHYQLSVPVARANALYQATILAPGVGGTQGRFTWKLPDGAALDARLAPPASLSGVADDRATGKPLASVILRAFPMVTPRPGVGPPILRVLADGTPVPVSGPFGVISPTVASTDAAGRFTFKDMLPGAYSLQVVSSAGTAPPAGPRPSTLMGTAEVKIAPGQHLKGLALKLSQPPGVNLTVLDAEGRPPGAGKRATLTIYSQAVQGGSRPSMGRRPAYTTSLSLDDQGRAAAWTGGTGTFQVTVSVEGAGWATTPWLTVADGKNPDAEMRLRPLRQVSGVVVDKATGDPVPNARVVLFATTPDTPRSVPGGNAGTDAAGRFLLPNVVPGRYRVLIFAAGAGAMQPAELDVPEDKDPPEIRLELEPRGGA